MKKNRFSLRNLGRLKWLQSLFAQGYKLLVEGIIKFIGENKAVLAEDLRKIGVNGIGVGLFGLFMPKTHSIAAASFIMTLSFLLWFFGLYLEKSAGKED